MSTEKKYIRKEFFCQYSGCFKMPQNKGVNFVGMNIPEIYSLMALELYRKIMVLVRLSGRRILGWKSIIRELSSITEFSSHNEKEKLLVGVYFSKDEPLDSVIVNIINEAREFILFAELDFLLPNIADALIRAVHRGVKVRGILEGYFVVKENRKVLVSRLHASGATVIIAPVRKGFMHLKILVTEQVAVSGSFNWTPESVVDNEEIIEIFKTPEIRWRFIEIIEGLLSAYGK